MQTSWQYLSSLHSRTANADITAATDAVILCHRYFISSSCLAQTTLTQPKRKTSCSFKSELRRDHKMWAPDSIHWHANVAIQQNPQLDADHWNGKQSCRAASCMFIALQSSDREREREKVCSAIQGYNLKFFLGHPPLSQNKPGHNLRWQG